MFNWIKNIFKKKNKKATSLISETMKKYKEEINFDSDEELLINGEKNIPYKKSYWVPQK